MRTRVISAIVLLPFILGIILVGGWSYVLLVVAATLIAGLEYTHMLRHKGYVVVLPFVWAMALLWQAESLWANGVWFSHSLAGLVILRAGWQVVHRERHPAEKNPTASWALALAGGLYLGVGGAYLIRLRALQDGLWWTLTALPVVWIADSGAYVAGRTMGHHKMSPVLSPGKTWEGYAGELLCGMLSGVLLGIVWPQIASDPIRLNPWNGLLLGTVLAALTPLGDLFVSMIKREVGVKDSGKLIPGHGGAFDRIDSLIWAGGLTWAVVTLLT